jgi:hypothetical protein
MDEVADATGGKAFYNTNGMKAALTEITESSSNYYTLAYAPTNHAWNAHRRQIRLTLPGRHVTVLYRHSYYARKERKEQRLADARETGSRNDVVPASLTAAGGQGSQPPEDQSQVFTDAMRLGAIPSGELLFNVSVTPDKAAIRLRPGEPQPPGNFLRADYEKKPLRIYHLVFVVDPRRVSFTLAADGNEHAQLDYATVVYDNEGDSLNALLSSTDVDLDEATYDKVMHQQLGLGIDQLVAVPEKGNFFLRMGVRDGSDNVIGTMEIPVDNIQRGVPGPAPALVQ